MNAYDGTPSWARYQEILKASFGLRLERSPAEMWREMRGHAVHLDVWEPAGASEGTMVLVHGAGGNGRVLAPFADMAAGLGWRVLAPDLPGYGLTRPARDYRGDYEDWLAIIADLVDDSPGPVVIMGLSAGGMTAALAAERAKKARGVIATTLLDVSRAGVLIHAARWRWLGALSFIGFHLAPWFVDRMAMPIRFAVNMNAMSGDPAMNAYFIRDRLLGNHWVGLRLFRTMHAQKATRLAPGCKLLLVHPGADAWTPTEISRPAFDRIDGPKEFVELTNGSHLPLEQPAFAELQSCIGLFLKSVSKAG